MRGRFTLTATADALAELFQLITPLDWSPRYNIAPTQQILVVHAQVGGGRRFAKMRWGLVPSWAKEMKGPPLINARAEGIETKPSFRNAIRQRRCLIPADGFYEWTGQGKKRHPYDFRLRGKKPFAFAGLWERWHDDGEPIESCTIITTEPNELVKPFHDRMPVILPRETWEQWLDPEMRDAEKATPLLRSYPAEEMEVLQVSDHANNARNDDPECLEPVSMF